MLPASYPYRTPIRKILRKQVNVAATGSVTPRCVADLAPANAKTTELRPDIGQAMRSEMVACDVEYFVSHYMPKCSPVILEAVLEHLKVSKALVPRPKNQAKSKGKGKKKPSTSPATGNDSEAQGATEERIPGRESYSYVLSDFKHKPSQLKKIYETNKKEIAPGDDDEPPKVDEKSVFSPLGDIILAIQSSLRQVEGAEPNRYGIRMCPDTHITSDITGCNHRIDACLTKNEADGLHITDIAVPFEFKLSRTKDEVYKNRLQLMSHVNHTMNDDSRRMFAYGITIEDDRMSIWYFSRSHSVKAMSFSIIAHADLFVEIMISLLCATDEQLGYDPHITLLDDRSFIYEFPPDGQNTGSVYYHTIESINESRTLRLTGRSTRIWKVLQVVSKTDSTPVKGATELILKDVSLDSNSPTEADIQDMLFKDVRLFAKDPNWQEHPFLEDFPEHYKTLLATALEGDNFKKYFSCITAKHVGSPTLSVHPDAWPAPDIFPKEAPPKQSMQSTYHSVRIGHPTPADSIPPLSISESKAPQKKRVSATQDPTPVAESDCIPGRTLAPRHQCRFILDSVCTPLHDIPTLGEAIDILEQTLIGLWIMFCAGWGTPYFMSCEIQTGRYLKEAKKTGGKLGKAKGKSGEGKRESRSEQVAHNIQHDLESIWWLMLWLATTRPKCLATGTASVFFQQRLDAEYASLRKLLFTESEGLAENEHLSRVPEPLKFFIHSGLEDLRNDLYAEYTERNKAPASRDDITSYSWVMSVAFSQFFDVIREARDDWGGIELVIETELQRALKASAMTRKTVTSVSVKRKLFEEELKALKEDRDSGGVEGALEARSSLKNNADQDHQGPQDLRRSQRLQCGKLKDDVQGQDVQPRPSKKARR
ncbi:other/FunK1 protein kinase [Coprinopsis cinerea okayama7|uniref:Other/FunK1 protein kinase n=1 Tax=Coprinopsis cinerea (strain Okayama-7 / 130 / ATCC MYA-4618 / FGSC 9003) TaxID=240176 RepID=D6RPL2_COPC7|nr:other/FunK1 protein kinase [Coprinopsis cinerea okayama7\|eukprot:XP_002910481.1 other/FunK1 protein kinase [Coprinopsis cinerea okayama7\